MERYLKQFDKEYMKMAMLKQEETFKHQVHELHRLYQLQKLLMKDMKNAELKRQQTSTQNRPGLERRNVKNERGPNQSCYSSNYFGQRKPHQTLDLGLQAVEYTGRDDGDVMLEVEEESDLELTLAIGSNRSRRKKEETSFTSDSGACFSSSSSESAVVKLKGQEWGLLHMTDISMRFPDDTKSCFNVEGSMRQDGLKQAPWLFQCLSLDLTS
ncbi:uncharacterized protein [Elaeis guineensis]|uniref:Uncharacterized protein LOC105058044 n=1 Tax=Elaeis guineensis var. tenera TaxID=51953 RepID=A0A6I9S862_ELAGV|nr:uncharacterized protein LOC105058044 [Elaeis guineensis]XP_010939123.1 uncharacterized protein LOC105058044 [Elaeis guineensis]